jgi:hypothetical protein
MTERLHDGQYPALISSPPSARWFHRQGENFLKAQTIIERIGVFPDDIRSYKGAVSEDDVIELILCDMALDAVKLARARTRFARYGVDSDLYDRSVKTFAIAKLGERAASSFYRSGLSDGERR